MTEASGRGEITAKADVSGKSRYRMDLSWQHIQTAALFSKKVAILEQEHFGDPLGSFWDEIFSYASSSILMMVASIEAQINEIAPEMAKSKQLTIIDKYKSILVMKGANAFDPGANPLQAVEAVIDLRNELVHFKPEWSDEREMHAKISEALRAKLRRSPFFPKEEPLFPMAWATHASTTWAFNACVAYVREFQARTGIPCGAFAQDWTP